MKVLANKQRDTITEALYTAGFSGLRLKSSKKMRRGTHFVFMAALLTKAALTKVLKNATDEPIEVYKTAFKIQFMSGTLEGVLNTDGIVLTYMPNQA